MVMPSRSAIWRRLVCCTPCCMNSSRATAWIRAFVSVGRLASPDEDIAGDAAVALKSRTACLPIGRQGGVDAEDPDQRRERRRAVLAYWLKRHGFEPTVVERAPGPRKTGGHAVDLFRPAMDIVEKMGCWRRSRPARRGRST
ncbi:hypothetical protein OV079_53250 [Nannocystis pusilla]|uniref:Uncharacterized protein n=1 Tax=Nannocystis pusilla TaxID=889268 RepID=A0A9X3J5I8_9BACT|nr:hypothetical protein [Nannocystis pusilla]MCY1014143.1 hypothetical protein [Nannocystis pusilla]